MRCHKLELQPLLYSGDAAVINVDSESDIIENDKSDIDKH